MPFDSNEKDALKGLNFAGGGIPETGSVNKNRSVLIQVDRDDYKHIKMMHRLSILLCEMVDGMIDSITIDVKERRWTKK